MRVNDVLTSYEFTQEGRRSVTLTRTRPKRRRPRTYQLSDSTYGRFVALANNSQRYFISILDEGQLGWRIRRQPIRCEHNHYIGCPFGCDPNGLAVSKEEPNHENAQPT